MTINSVPKHAYLQRQILRELTEQDGLGLTQLAEMLEKRVSNIKMAVDTLEFRGFIETKYQQVDGHFGIRTMRVCHLVKQ